MDGGDYRGEALGVKPVPVPHLQVAPKASVGGGVHRVQASVASVGRGGIKVGRQMDMFAENSRDLLLHREFKE